MHKSNCRDAPAIDATPARRRGVVVYFRSFQPTRPTHWLISTQVRMPQISGLKWKDETLHDLDVFRERKLKMTKKDDLEDFGDIGGAASLNIDRAMIARFLREECVVTGASRRPRIASTASPRRVDGAATSHRWRRRGARGVAASPRWRPARPARHRRDSHHTQAIIRSIKFKRSTGGGGTRTATRALLPDCIVVSTTGSACRIRPRSW